MLNKNPNNSSRIGKEHEASKLKVVAKKSLDELKIIEQQRISAGTHKYVSSYDISGKLTLRLIKK